MMNVSQVWTFRGDLPEVLSKSSRLSWSEFLKFWFDSAMIGSWRKSICLYTPVGPIMKPFSSLVPLEDLYNVSVTPHLSPMEGGISP